MAKPTKKHKVTAKEKRVYQDKKKEEKGDKGNVAPQEKIMQRVWAITHTGIDQEIFD